MTKLPLSVTTGPAGTCEQNRGRSMRHGRTFCDSHTKGSVWRTQHGVQIVQHLGIGEWDDFDWNSRFELGLGVRRFLLSS